MTVLQSNATLTRVQLPGSGEAVDGPAAAGADVWTGATEALVDDRRRRARDGEKGDVLVERSMIVLTTDPSIDWRTGMIATYAYPVGGAPLTATIAFVDRASIDDTDIPADVRTVSLVFAAA